MKKLSMMLAVAALVATGCDPYDDAPGGTPTVIAVTASGRTAAGGLRPSIEAAVPETGNQWALESVPVGSGGNNVIVITTNKLLDSKTIQTAQQNPADATSTGDCRPAAGWLKITKNVVNRGEETEPLTYDDPAVPEPVDDPATPEENEAVTQATLDDWQWYSCYYAGAATSNYGASIQIFRAKVTEAPGFVAAGSPMRVARLEPATNYVITGTVKDEGGADLAINVSVKTRIAAPAVNPTPVAANSVILNWTPFQLSNPTTGVSETIADVTYKVFRAKAKPVADKPGEFTAPAAADYAEITGAVPTADTYTYSDASQTDFNTVPYYYRVTATLPGYASNNSANTSTAPHAPALTVEPSETSGTTELVIRWIRPNATAWTLFRGTDPEDAATFTEVITSGTPNGADAPTSFSFTHPGLAAETEYFYMLVMENALGEAEVIGSGETEAPPAP